MRKPEKRKPLLFFHPKSLKALPYVLSGISLIIAISALNQARIANSLSIEPYITVKPVEGRSSSNLMNFIMKNEGKVSVNYLNIEWVFAAAPPPGMKESSYLMNTEFITSDSLPKKKTFSFSIDLISEVTQSKKEKVNTPNGILNIEIGKMHLLGIKAVYRRASDLRRFESTYYFVIQKIDPFNIIIDDLSKEKYCGIFSNEIDKLDSKFFILGNTPLRKKEDA